MLEHTTPNATIASSFLSSASAVAIAINAGTVTRSVIVSATYIYHIIYDMVTTVSHFSPVNLNRSNKPLHTLCSSASFLHGSSRVGSSRVRSTTDDFDSWTMLGAPSAG